MFEGHNGGQCGWSEKNQGRLEDNETRGAALEILVRILDLFSVQQETTEVVKWGNDNGTTYIF